jgi:hypothetical protein
MLTINTYSLAFLVKINNELTVPIQLFSTKVNAYGPFFIGDIFIPNNLLKADQSEPLNINMSIRADNSQSSYLIPFVYLQEENAWVFSADKHIIQYDIYTLSFPFNLDVVFAFSTGTIYKKNVSLTNDTSLIFLPNSDIFIRIEVLESNYLIKLNNISQPFDLIITAINTNVLKTIRLTNPKEHLFLSGEPNGCLYINEIFLKYDDKVENIILNKFDSFEEPFFVKGTLIKTPTGFKPIETIKTGSKIMNQRNRVIDVVSTNSRILKWVDGIIYKKNTLFIHKNIKILGKEGILNNPDKQGLEKAAKHELCGNSDICVSYSLELPSPADKIILTDDTIADSFLNKKHPKQVFICIYSWKFIKEIE